MKMTSRCNISIMQYYYYHYYYYYYFSVFSALTLLVGQQGIWPVKN